VSARTDAEGVAAVVAGTTSVADAEARVARAGAAFSESLHEASLAGRETAERVASTLRPLLLGAGVLAGALVVARLWRSSGRSRAARPAVSTRSPWAVLVRSAGVALATMAARRLAERWILPE